MARYGVMDQSSTSQGCDYVLLGELVESSLSCQNRRDSQEIKGLITKVIPRINAITPAIIPTIPILQRTT